MKKKITLRSIAADFGVSSTTVLRALKGSPNVRIDLQKKIIHYAARHKYSLPNHRTGNIAIIIPNMTLQYYLETMLRALYLELSTAGFHTFILTEADVEYMNEYEYDGVLSTTWIPGFEKSFPKAHILPCVSVNTLGNQMEKIISVVSDDFSGITEGMNYLYQAGCRRIFFMLGSTMVNLGNSQRENAFIQFCKSHNLPFESFISKDTRYESIQSSVEVALKLNADAFFCANEGISQKVYYVLHQHGLRIPEDISVLGLEANDEGQYMIPPLTALHQDFEQLAHESVLTLQRLIRGEKVRGNLVVPCKFKERASVRKNNKKSNNS